MEDNELFLSINCEGRLKLTLISENPIALFSYSSCQDTTKFVYKNKVHIIVKSLYFLLQKTLLKKV